MGAAPIGHRVHSLGAVKWLAIAVVMVSGCAAGAATSPDGTTARTDGVSPPSASESPSTLSSGDTAGSRVVSTSPDTAAPSPAEQVLPAGFDRVAARVTAPDGETCEICLWLADTSGQRERGLMFVTDLGPADGMAFVYPRPHTGGFWMKNTVLPLSIAFFAADGGYLSAFDMEPCAADPCPSYPTAKDFSVALETTQGGLADLDIVEGSTLILSDLPCAGG